MGLLQQTFYRWKIVYDWMGVSEMRRVKQFEDKNRKLKHLVTDLRDQSQ
jgi:putative transposase